MAETPTSNDTAPRRRVQRAAAALLAATVLAACGSDATTVEVDATIDGTPLTEADASNPIPIDDSESQLEIVMTNTADTPQEIRYLRLEGDVLGLTFLTYTTSLRIALDGNETRSLTVPLDFFDVESQGHGYLSSQLAVYGGEGRTRLGSTDFVSDVRGSVTSTMAVFAFLLVAVTALSLLVNLGGLARGSLPSNRFWRGLQFAVSGFGIGLVLTISFSVLRVFPLPAAVWWPLVAVSTAAAFAFGYLSPGPDDAPEIDEEARELDELLAEIADADH